MEKIGKKSKIIVKNTVPQPDKCPLCGAFTKKYGNRNFPFGDKSKARYVRGRKCTKCGYRTISNPPVSNRAKLNNRRK